MDTSGEELHSDGSANMVEEWTEGTLVEFSLEALDSAAVDSGCNRLVMKDKPTLDVCPIFTYVLTTKARWLGTAAAHGRLDILATGVITSLDGICTEYMHCPDASTTLVPNLALTRNRQMIQSSTEPATDDYEEHHWMSIKCRDDYPKQIECVLVNEIFRISKIQLFDILCRGGYTVDE